MFDKILIICIGNICRSPSAERILQQLMPNKEITSAGISALVDEPIEENAAQLLNSHHYNSDNHHARQVSTEIVNNAELILVMEKKHQQILMQKYPAASGKVMLLGKWNNEQEIHDPYKKSNDAFEHAFIIIEKNCNVWASRLN